MTLFSPCTVDYASYDTNGDDYLDEEFIKLMLKTNENDDEMQEFVEMMAPSEYEKQLSFLRMRIHQLETMCYAQVYGIVSSTRVQLLLDIERLQRVTCGLAQEKVTLCRELNYSIQEIEQQFLHDLAFLLYGTITTMALTTILNNQVCTDAILYTIQLASNGFQSCNQIDRMGWKCSHRIEQDSMHLYSMTKEMINDIKSFQQVTEGTWELLNNPNQLLYWLHNSAYTSHVHVLQYIQQDALLVAVDTVVSVEGNCHVERDVRIIFRESRDESVWFGVCSLSPSLWKDQLQALDSVQWKQQGIQWIQCSPTKNGYTVTYGGYVPFTHSTNYVDILSSVRRWEQTVVGSCFHW